METIPNIILPLLLALLVVAGMWRVFQKAGESGWKALIPVYNVYIMLRIAGHSGWWLVAIILPPLLQMSLPLLLTQTNLESQINPYLLQTSGLESLGMMAVVIMTVLAALFLLYVIAFIVHTVILYDITRSFGKGLGFAIGLTLLPFVFWPILGFGKAAYRGPVAHPKMVGKGSGAHVEASKSKEEKQQSDSAEADDQSEQEE